jgi:ketosteroid isomerase-like protein
VQKSRSKLLTEAYAAFNRRDIDSVLALMAPDVNWPNGLEGGRLIGHDLVRAYWTRQWGILNPRVDPVGIEEDGTRSVVVHVHQVVHDLSGNLHLDQFIQHVYSFQGDLIERMDIREAPETDHAKDLSSAHT